MVEVFALGHRCHLAGFVAGNDHPSGRGPCGGPIAPVPDSGRVGRYPPWVANPRMTAEIGRVLGGRYRLVAPIGMGASAQVYLADDVKLRRRVALKMLHDALAGDAEFLRRFRAEARAAAALSHPNVMAVYDWSDGSDEGEVAFIVTEYLPGGSLRALLDSGAQLSPSQALGVGLEAARALDYAHRRGFVHRDIKPANLLFGEEQRLRIADFGLARALAEAAWTEPQGAVLGTARYASPEQAKGEHLSGKADVYSLALVLVEAVTGEVPFVADTTLGTLMARVDKPLVVSDELGPLQEIVAQAGHPDPEQRIDARTLAKGLLRAAHELSRPAPLPLVGALASGAAAGPTPTRRCAPGPLGRRAGTRWPATSPPTTWSWSRRTGSTSPNRPMLAGVPEAAIGASPMSGGRRAGCGRGGADPDAEPVEPRDPAGRRRASRTPSPMPSGGRRPVERRTDGGGHRPTRRWSCWRRSLTAEADRSPPTRATDRPGGGGGGDHRGRRRRWRSTTPTVRAVAGAAGRGWSSCWSCSWAVAGGRRRRRQPGPGVHRLAGGPSRCPTLVGRTEAQATAIARAGGWKVRTVAKRQNGSTKGEVLATLAGRDPPAPTVGPSPSPCPMARPSSTSPPTWRTRPSRTPLPRWRPPAWWPRWPTRPTAKTSPRTS